MSLGVLDMKMKKTVKKHARKKASRKRGKQSVKRKTARGSFTYLYVLRSQLNSHKTYIGVTNDVMRRLRQHNGQLSGGARYTHRFRPWSFYAIFRMNSRRDALSLEWHVKHRRRARVHGHGVAGIVNYLHMHGPQKDGFCELVNTQL